MNKVNFEQTGGFPLEANTLSFLQSAYGQLSGFAGLGGQSYILNGCTVADGNVTDGTIVINGEVLPFVGGPKLSRVIIEETVTDKTFEDGVSKPVYYTRVAKMAAAGGVMDFDSLKRVSNLMALSDRIKDQEVIKWGPVSDNTSIVLGTHDCWMFKMGRLVVFSGYLYFTNTNSATQNSISIKGFPAIGNIVTTQYGLTDVSKSDNMTERKNSLVYRNTDDPFLTFIVTAPANTTWLINFSITLFTV
ncbi:hypothetical protein [Sphingobacterium siyangense]|uniref:hypothetical protein n=1 Tax=Sphingobacterium siyangense TaxID=459529 RepID=UPI0030173537